MATRRAGVRADEDEYTQEERDLIDRYIARLRMPSIRNFLRESDQRVSGTKRTLLGRIEEALDAGDVTYTQLVRFLDEVEPWRAQQVFLFGASSLNLDAYRTPEAFDAHLRAHRASKPYRQPIPLVLPDELTIASIQHDGRRLRITAIERREGWIRDESYDPEEVERTEGNEEVQMRAYVRRITRGQIIFEWDVVENLAMMQVSRLPSGEDYDDARDRFAKLVSRWLDIGTFPLINLPTAIKTLHLNEEARKAASQEPALKSYGVEYARQGGARLAGLGATSEDSVTDDPVLSSALDQFRNVSQGRRGNFYWALDPLGADYVGSTAHVIVFAATRRITFPTDDLDEATIRHVLSDIRAASV
jgi:hypothetical protein